MKALTLTLITDVHMGHDHHDEINNVMKLGSAAESLLKKVIAASSHSDAIISMGDMINERDVRVDAKNIRRYRRIVSGGKTPSHFLIGNHDVKHLSDTQLKTALNVPRLYYAKECGDYAFVFLYPDSRKRKAAHNLVLLRERQLAFLRSYLRTTTKKVIVFSHYPLDEQSIIGNSYEIFFTKVPWRKAIHNRTEIRHILERSKKVIAVFTGHLHWYNTERINGIPYITVPSLIETERGKPCGKYLEAKIYRNKVICRVRRVH